MVGATEFEKLVLVENHFLAIAAGECIVAFHGFLIVALVIILGEIDGLFGANLFAEPTEDAAEHVDLEILRHLLGTFAMGVLAVFAWGRDADGLGRADKFAELAAHALGVVILVTHQIRRAAETLRHGPEFLRIVQRSLELVVLVFLFVDL